MLKSAHVFRSTLNDRFLFGFITLCGGVFFFFFSVFVGEVKNVMLQGAAPQLARAGARVPTRRADKGTCCER